MAAVHSCKMTSLLSHILVFNQGQGGPTVTRGFKFLNFDININL
jgi:hypothetical protein